MIDNNNYELVYAKEEDCELLFKWANDRDVRLNSFNSEQIKYEDHVKWFNDKIKSNNSSIYLFKVNDINVGLIRLDKIDKDTYLINYSIAKEHRRKGYATILLRLIKDKYKDNLLIGKVKNENIASIKAFIRAKYIMKKEQDIYVFYSFDKK